ncbi:MAG: glycosyltransferase family 4 protein [Dehalococcoidia bacterium]|nr:glycosyltransferase family 4 protein [Dehalococcoidia bacterium]
MSRTVAFVNQPWCVSTPPPTSSLEIWTYEVARRMARDGSRVIVTGGLHARTLRAQRFVDQGVEYQLLPVVPDNAVERLARRLPGTARPDRPLITSRGYFLPYAVRAALALRKERPDVIHIMNQFPFAPVIRRFNPRAAIVLHMQCEWLSQVDRKRVVPALRAVDAVVGCSGHITQLIEARFPGASCLRRTVHNAVDVDAFQPAARCRREDDAPRVLFVGRVSPEKGVHTLVEAFEQLRERRPGATLTLAGPIATLPAESIVRLSRDPLVTALERFYEPGAGSYHEHLLARTAPGTRDAVTFAGNLGRDQVARAFAEADVLVNPSLSESFGMSLVEAMASGLPVVATRVGGMPEVVEDGVTGHLVAPDAPAALAGAIERALDDRARLGCAGRHRAEALFSWERIAAETAAVHTEALAHVR